MASKRGTVDAFYTPQWAAEALASALPGTVAGPVLDPSVGGGALLSAVEKRFGTAVDLLGLDVNPEAVRRLRSTHSHWAVSTADLLSARSRASTLAWRAARENLDAVVMNPPFSYRGNGGALIDYGGFRGRVSPSVHFLTEVVKSLDPVHGFYAILPDGALDAERHLGLWAEIAAAYSVDRLERLGTSSFRGARVATSIVRIRRLQEVSTRRLDSVPTKPSSTAPRDTSCRCLEVVRGRVSLHSLGAVEGMEPSAPFIHTTDLSSMVLQRFAPDRLADDAPLVVFGRVGKWHAPRLIEVGRIVLSDCLFGLRPRTQSSLSALMVDLATLEPSLRARMRGTGAPTSP
ncbi:methyltransferase [Plantibacter sp. M259]|uniref:methyltransferase n=1 Tax=Plantibacter sp. M259 TaxID=2583822 RepID=UPI001110B599